MGAHVARARLYLPEAPDLEDHAAGNVCSDHDEQICQTAERWCASSQNVDRSAICLLICLSHSDVSVPPRSWQARYLLRSPAGPKGCPVGSICQQDIVVQLSISHTAEAALAIVWQAIE